MTMTQSSEDVRTKVGAFVRDNFLYLHPGLDLQDTDDLLGLGVMDSMGFVELVEHVQQQFHVPVRDAEITADNFGSVDAIVRFVTSKRAP